MGEGPLLATTALPAWPGSPHAVSPRQLLLLQPFPDVLFLEGVFGAQIIIARGVGSAEVGPSILSPGAESPRLSEAGRMAGLRAGWLPALGPAVSRFRPDTCRARAGPGAPGGRGGAGKV